MKKILLFLIAITSLFTLTSCSLNKYEEEAGVYNLYYMGGDLDESMYEYYRITLYASGICLTESKGADSEDDYSGYGIYKIEDGKITITSLGLLTAVEKYDYVDGEIHIPPTSFLGITFSAKFKRD